MSLQRSTFSPADLRHLQVVAGLVTALTDMVNAQPEPSRGALVAIADTVQFHVERLCEAADLEADGWLS